jgi:hypothetical protein
MSTVEVQQAEAVLQEAFNSLKCDVGLLKFRWFIRVVSYAVSELVKGEGDLRLRSVNKGKNI